jgi:hypothetical protein
MKVVFMQWFCWLSIFLISLVLNESVTVYAESTRSKANSKSEIPVHIPCEMLIRSAGEGPELASQLQLELRASGGGELKVSRVAEAHGSGRRIHFKISDILPLAKNDLAFLMIDANERKEGLPGLAYRGILYPSYDPRAIRETFFVLNDSTAEFKEPIVISREDMGRPDEELAAALNLALMRLFPKADSSFWSVFPVYGKDSAEAALEIGLKRFSQFDEVMQGPRKLTEEDIIKMAGGNEGLSSQLKSTLKKFSTMYTTPEIKRGYFGDFEESWFVVKGIYQFDEIKLARTSFFKIVRVGPMNYIYVFAMDAPFPQGRKKM